MPIPAGTQLGPYEIMALLGAGGMGEVYRARDTRLRRDVAIKVLPTSTTSSPERRERFAREARAIAALNHPNICTVFDVGHVGGMDYLVMELVEGGTLAAQLRRGPMQLPDFFRTGSEIALALHRAHLAGILHRDLKPANIMLTKTGAKLMDFGLARFSGRLPTQASNESQLPTATYPLTQDGQILGTFQYMSPEQLEGHEADIRSDVWSLGATLYEMVTGKRAFTGTSTASLIGSILREPPAAMSAYAPAIPPELERLILTCLAKNPDDRWQNAGDLARELRSLGNLEQRSATDPRDLKRSAHRRGGLRRELLLGLGIGIAVAAIAAVAHFRSVHVPERRLVRTSIVLPTGPTVVYPASYAISPDGSAVALTGPDSAGVWRLYLRRLDEVNARVLTNQEGASMPFWSPDSREIGFQTDEGKLARISANGGPIQIVADARNLRGGAWNTQGWIVFCPDGKSGLFRVRATGGEPEPLTTPDLALGEASHELPVFLPDGKHFIYAVIGDPAWRRFRIRVGTVDGGASHALMEADAMPRCSREGRLVFIRDRTLFTQRVTPTGDRLLGEAVALSESPSRVTAQSFVGGGVSLGQRILAFDQADPRGTALQWFDSSGRVSSTIARLDGPFTAVTLSPDCLKATIHYTAGMETNLWLVDLRSGLSSRLNSADRNGSRPYWFADSRSLLYRSVGAEGVRAEVIDTRNPQVVSMSIAGTSPLAIRGDGRQVVVRTVPTIASGKPSVLEVAERDSGWRTRPFPPDSSIMALGAHFFGDGRYLVYSTRLNRGIAIFAVPFPSGGVPQLLTEEPVGDPQSHERFWVTQHGLVYCALDGRTLRMASLEVIGGRLRVGRPRTLFTLPHEYRGVCPTPDGSRFLVAVPIGHPQAPHLSLVQNWESELDAR